MLDQISKPLTGCAGFIQWIYDISDEYLSKIVKLKLGFAEQYQKVRHERIQPT
jgi:hypothetical protein